jgi:hypothetical protein
VQRFRNDLWNGRRDRSGVRIEWTRSREGGLKTFTSFADFYPFYLSEHSHPACRRLHFAGSLAVLITLGAALLTGRWSLLLLLPVIGYGFAWVGHIFFEHNRPATFTHPLYSFMGDWVMFKDMIVGRIRF